MLILLAALPHFELRFSSEPAVTHEPFSYELQEMDRNVNILLGLISPERDPERRIWVKVVYWGSDPIGMWEGQAVNDMQPIKGMLPGRLPLWDSVQLRL